ncbi:hypothetical protein ACEPAG_2247 [Sanghuangporus baumii]
MQQAQGQTQAQNPHANPYAAFATLLGLMPPPLAWSSTRFRHQSWIPYGRRTRSLCLSLRYDGSFARPISPRWNGRFQLQQLQDMGFSDAAQNVRALLAIGGNVNAAIEYILGGGGL